MSPMIVLLSVAMFAAVGFAVAHVTCKTGEGAYGWMPVLPLALAGALVGGLGALAIGMTFYGLLGHMVVAMGCATLAVLVWRQVRA